MTSSMDMILGMISNINVPENILEELKAIKSKTFAFLLALVVSSQTAVNNHLDTVAVLSRCVLLYTNVKNSKNTLQILHNFGQFFYDTWQIDKEVISVVLKTFIPDLCEQFFGLRAESTFEEKVSGFWDVLDGRNPRSILTSIWNLWSTATTLTFISQITTAVSSPTDVMKIASFISSELHKRGTNEKRVLKNLSLNMSQVGDWLQDNLEAILNLRFQDISWTRDHLDSIPTKIALLREEITRVENGMGELLSRRERYKELRTTTVQLFKMACSKMNSSLRVSDQSAYKRLSQELEVIRNKIDLALNPQENKEQPFVVGYIGPPCMGKSSIASQAGRQIQRAFGRDPDPAHHNAYIYGSKFQEGFTSNTDIIMIDDIGQDLEMIPNSQEFLTMANTPTPLIMKAEASEKKMHKYRNCGVIMTSNRDDLGLQFMKAHETSALTRRVNLIVRLEPSKPEYTDEYTGGLNLDHPDLRDGYNNSAVKITVYRVGNFTNKEDEEGRKTPPSKWKLDMLEVSGWRTNPEKPDTNNHLEFIYEEAKKHYQREKLNRAKLESEDHICDKCLLSTTFCNCCVPEKELTAEALWDGLAQLKFPKMNIQERLENYSSNLFTYMETPRLLMFDYVRLFTNRTERFFISNQLKYFKGKFAMKTLMWLYKHMHAVGSGYLLLVLSLGLIPKICYALLSLGSIMYMREKLDALIIQSALVLTLNYVYFQIYCGEHGLIDNIMSSVMFFVLHTVMLPPVILMIYLRYYQKQGAAHRAYLIENNLYRSHEGAFRKLYLGSTILLGVTLIYQAYTMFFKKNVSEAMLDIAVNSDKIYDPVRRRPERYVPPFKQIHERTTGDKMLYNRDIAERDEKAKTTTASDMRSKLEKASFRIRVVDRQTGYSTTANAHGHNYGCITPRHLFPPQRDTLFDVYVERVGPRISGESRHIGVNTNDIYYVPNEDGTPSDLCWCPLSNTPPSGDFKRYLSKDTLPDNVGGYQALTKVGEKTVYLPVKLTSTYREKKLTYKDSQRGDLITAHYVYKVENNQNVNSEEGMCGSLVFDKHKAMVLGIHIAGNQSNTWYVKKINARMLDALDDLLTEGSHFYANSVPDDFDMICNNKGYGFISDVTEEVIDQIPAKRNPFVELGYLTSGGGLATVAATSWYFPSNNPNLEKVWGPPQSRPPVSLNGQDAINTTLEKLADPADGVEINYLLRGAEDYFKGFTKSGHSFKRLIEEFKDSCPDFFKVRSVEEAMRGDGTGQIRGIPNGSSAGHPFGGKKQKYYQRDVADGENYLELRNLVPEVRELLEQQEEIFRSGAETCEAFMRHSKANELLPWEKAEEKTRSFYSNNMVFFVNARRAFIPLKHLLMGSEELSEMYVGMASQGKGWETFLKNITNDGEYDNFVCGDYKGFDTRITKSVLEQVALFIMKVNREGGMSENDLTYLRSCLGIIIAPIIVWEGHVIRTANGQPSGQPLTVEMNSIANSILMRAAFYKIMDTHYPHLSGANFRSLVGLATYGDDNAMGVHKSIPLFNHTEIQKVMKTWGIDYTMADKGAESRPYIPLREVSFLKRTPAFNPRVGLMAPIEEESIRKALYYYVRPSNTPMNFKEQFVSQAINASREAAQYGRAYYEQFKKDIEFIREGTEHYTCKKNNPENFLVSWEDLTLSEYDDIISSWQRGKYYPQITEFALKIKDKLPQYE